MQSRMMGDITARIREIYSELEGVTFSAVFEDRVQMELFRLPAHAMRPVYRVKDEVTRLVLRKIHSNMRILENKLGEEIWKGITTSGGGCKLWGTEESVDDSDDGTYHIPVGGIEVILDGVVKYAAIVNITVERNS